VIRSTGVPGLTDERPPFRHLLRKPEEKREADGNGKDLENAQHWLGRRRELCVLLGTHVERCAVVTPGHVQLVVSLEHLPETDMP
jgi:hypothetical protein